MGKRNQAWPVWLLAALLGLALPAPVGSQSPGDAPGSPDTAARAKVHPRNPAIKYINQSIPATRPPDYRGQRYEATAPATLDLAERAALAVNALTETLDPDNDYELFWLADLLAGPPIMYHTSDDHVQGKFYQALPLVRTASGSRQNLDVEYFLMKNLLYMQGPDGLIYFPVKGRPWGLPPAPSPWAGIDALPTGDQWCSLGCMSGRVLGALCIYGLKDPEGPWKEAARKLFLGFKRIIAVDGDIAYLCQNYAEPGKPIARPKTRPIRYSAAYGSNVAHGLLQYYRAFGDKEALELATKMIRYNMGDAQYFGSNGEFLEEFPGQVMAHFHSHGWQIIAALDIVRETGDRDLLARALKAYDYGRSQGEPLIGFFPEWVKTANQCTSEMCQVSDMITAAVFLSLIGVDKWDDVDRWVRNQFAECQMTGVNWLTDGHLKPIDRAREKYTEYTVIDLRGNPKYNNTDRVAQKNIGAFAGWPMPNDLIKNKGWTFMHCCTGNATRTIYYVWENILHYGQGKLKVNLLLNRASRWADIDSHIPYRGQVDVKIKQDLELAVRIPEWVSPAEATCTINGRSVPLRFEGRYAQVGPVRKKDAVSLRFPIAERTHKVKIQGADYTIITRGNDVVALDPPGVNCPLYQRGYYRNGTTLWKKVSRFVPNEEIRW